MAFAGLFPMAEIALRFEHAGGLWIVVAMLLLLAAALAHRRHDSPGGRLYSIIFPVLLALSGACFLLAFTGFPAVPPVLTPWLALLFILAAGGLFASLYRPLKKTLKPATHRRLLAVRCAVGFGLAMLLFRPVFSYHFGCASKPRLWMMLDDSASMSVVDREGDVSRFYRARNAALNPSGAWKDALDTFGTKFFTVSSGVPRFVTSSELLSAKPTGDTTEFLDFFRRGLGEFLGENGKLRASESPAAIVLFTDGRDLSGVSPRDAARGLGKTPVHGVLIGKVARGERVSPDIALRDVETPPVLAAGERAEILVRGRIKGISGLQTRLALRYRSHGDGRSESEKNKAAAGESPNPADWLEAAGINVTLYPGPFVQRLNFRLEEEGEVPFEVEMVPVEGEELTSNNKLRFTLTAGPAPIRVLYIDLVSAESKFLARHLERDPRVNALILRKVTNSVFTRRRVGGSGAGDEDTLDSLDTLDPDRLKDYDLFVIGDLDATHFSSEALQAMAQRVREGAGLIMLGGESSAGRGGYGKTPLADILPVTVSENDPARPGAFYPVITREGRLHPIFQGIADMFANIPGKEAPARLELWTGCGKVFPDSQVLLTQPALKGGDGRPAPVFVVRRVGEGRSVIFLSTSTWRWKELSRKLSGKDMYAVFWSQLMRWVTKREPEQSTSGEAGETVRTWTPLKRYHPASRVPVYAEVRDASGQLSDAASLFASVRTAGEKSAAAEEDAGEETAFVSINERPGIYRCLLPESAARAGRKLSVRVEGTLGEKKLPAAATSLEIMPAVSELEETDPEPSTLESLAEATGGSVVELDDIEQLGEHLLDAAGPEVSGRGRIRLGAAWFWFPAVVGLLLVEWWLRRRLRLP